MTTRPKASAHHQPPDRSASMACYKMRADTYDSELLAFEPLRHQAIARLDLRGGETVLDVGCGTGLSFAPLKSLLGEEGRIIGIDQSSPMILKAQERVHAHGWQGITLVNEAVETAPLQGLADAALFHFTHDILRQPKAIANIMAHLRPGAKVVATGLQWAAPWVWPVNAFVWGAAMYSVSTMEGLLHPWSILASYLEDLNIQPTWMGGIYIASGTRLDGLPCA